MRARWWVLAVAGLLTASAVVVTTSGVLTSEEPAPTAEASLSFPEPQPVAPALEPVNLQQQTVLPAQVRRSLDRLLSVDALGPRVSASIVSGSGDAVYQRSAGRPATPASV